MNGDLYEDKDVVDVEHGGQWLGRVPKAWIGTGLLPDGAKQGTGNKPKATGAN